MGNGAAGGEAGAKVRMAKVANTNKDAAAFSLDDEYAHEYLSTMEKKRSSGQFAFPDIDESMMRPESPLDANAVQYNENADTEEGDVVIAPDSRTSVTSVDAEAMSTSQTSNVDAHQQAKGADTKPLKPGAKKRKKKQDFVHKNLAAVSPRKTPRVARMKATAESRLGAGAKTPRGRGAKKTRGTTLNSLRSAKLPVVRPSLTVDNMEALQMFVGRRMSGAHNSEGDAGLTKLLQHYKLDSEIKQLHSQIEYIMKLGEPFLKAKRSLLLLVSSRTPNIQLFLDAVVEDACIIKYNYDEVTGEDLQKYLDLVPHTSSTYDGIGIFCPGSSSVLRVTANIDTHITSIGSESCSPEAKTFWSRLGKMLKTDGEIDIMTVDIGDALANILKELTNKDIAVQGLNVNESSIHMLKETTVATASKYFHIPSFLSWQLQRKSNWIDPKPRSPESGVELIKGRYHNTDKDDADELATNLDDVVQAPFDQNASTGQATRAVDIVSKTELEMLARDEKLSGLVGMVAEEQAAKEPTPHEPSREKTETGLPRQSLHHLDGVEAHQEWLDALQTAREQSGAADLIKEAQEEDPDD